MAKMTEKSIDIITDRGTGQNWGRFHMISCADYLTSGGYSQTLPQDFYRDLFPLGELDKRNAMTKGKYCAIAVQIAKDDKKIKRYTITDEQDNLKELLGTDEFTVISPLSYAGKSQKSEMARYCYAIAIDLDDIKYDEDTPQGLMNLFAHIEDAKITPRPTYIVCSSERNLHLYYLLDKPYPLYREQKESLSRYKTWLTKQVWSYYICKDYKNIQQEPVGQPMRAVGSITKSGNDRVKAFKVGDKVSIDYLNSFTHREEQKIAEPDRVAKAPKRDADKPKQLPAIADKAFYHWYLNTYREHTQEGRRYFCIMVLAIIARKCAIPFEQLQKDALNEVEYLDSLTKGYKNHFDEADALKAITAYSKEHFRFMRRETLVKLSGVPMQANKRNGRNQRLHLKLARANLEILNEDAGNALQGRKPKRLEVIEYIAQHPGLSNRKIAESLGVDKNTVNKYVKEIKQSGMSASEYLKSLI